MTKLFKLVFFVIFGSLSSAEEREPKIVGGTTIDIRLAPYQALLSYRGTSACGGAILTQDIIITAAHCLDGMKHLNLLKIRVGSTFSKFGGKLVGTDKTIIHPQYVAENSDYDVGLVHLTEKLIFSDTIRPISLPTTYEIPNNALVRVTGWGLLEEDGEQPLLLQAVNLQKFSDENCLRVYPFTQRMICAGSNDGRDACQGDSGGPLTYSGMLYGIVSFGYGCARPGFPGVYTKVSTVSNWIVQNVLSLSHQ